MKATGKLSTGVAQVRKTRPFASISTTLSGCKGFASVGGSRVSRTTATWPHGWPSTSTTSFMPATSPSAQSKISTGALPSAGKASKHKLKAATGAFLADILLFARPSVTGRSYRSRKRSCDFGSRPRLCENAVGNGLVARTDEATRASVTPASPRSTAARRGSASLASGCMRVPASSSLFARSATFSSGSASLPSMI